MIASDFRLLGPQEGIENLWLQLRRFQNISHNLGMIIKYQNPPKRYIKFAEKQSQQIRHCLIQAEEYFRASKSVGYATSSLLLYYSIMSLSLADILIKQDGDSSLDRLRQNHNHHGLELKGGNEVKPGKDLYDSAGALRATPHERSQSRVGTFNVWHRSAREASLAGSTKTMHAAMNSTSRREIVLLAEDKELPQIPAEGVSLLDCFKNVPSMQAFLHGFGIPSDLCRARIERTNYDPSCGLPLSGKIEYRIYIHPQMRENIDSVVKRIAFHPRLAQDVDASEAGGGFIVRVTLDPEAGYGFKMPSASQENVENITFYSRNDFLNEYGYLYIGLFILGNYARYFPDKWMQELELATPLAVAAMEFINVANDRMPLLANAALSNTVFLRP